MRPRILIPFMMLVLVCVSTSTRAAGARAGNGTHAHIHKHGNSAHLHTHTESHEEHERESFGYACDDEAHNHCCGDHDHNPDRIVDGLNTRSRDLPTFGAGIVSTIPDTLRLPIREPLLRWAPLHQRPPDYLRALRTCVMLN